MNSFAWVVGVVALLGAGSAIGADGAVPRAGPAAGWSP